MITGPSGVGKGTLIEKVLPRIPSTRLARSATTRPRREHEVDGREYFFLSPEEFEERVKDGDFLEHVRYGSHLYGTLRSEVLEDLRAGHNVILEIEVEGAMEVRRQVPGAVLIFIEPPSVEELRKRLVGRDTEVSAEIEARLARAGEELALRDEFDYIVVNDDLDRAAAGLERLIKAELEGAGN